ncbi:MAG TPA: hypothetical protein VJ774_00725 [Actinomycetota bacterium]|nr:hypothetical protein [Actinomycetota bacterium]
MTEAATVIVAERDVERIPGLLLAGPTRVMFSMISLASVRRLERPFEHVLSWASSQGT